jgi:iron transport multicopper oxidase
MRSLSRVLLLAALSGMAYAAIGPVADLPIVNVVIEPDGYSRE